MVALKSITFAALVGLSSAVTSDKHVNRQLASFPTCRMACPEGQICSMGDMGVAGCHPITAKRQILDWSLMNCQPGDMGVPDCRFTAEAKRQIPDGSGVFCNPGGDMGMPDCRILPTQAE